jgi:hypothetical protein
MRLFLFASMMAFAGCTTSMPPAVDDAGTDAGGRDANFQSDARVDGGARDGGVVDAGAMIDLGAGHDAFVDDAGSDGGIDAGAHDGGTDAAVIDMGRDAYASDAGIDLGIDVGLGLDAFVNDAGVDASTNDAGVDAGGDAGCASCPTVLLLAGSTTSIFGGTYTSAGGWATSTIAGAASYPPVLTALSDGTALGAFTDPSMNVMATTWSGTSWSTPAWIGGNATSRAQPMLDSSGTVGHLAYHGMDFHFYYVPYRLGAWSGTSQSMGGNYGPVPAAIAALGANATAAFVDGQGPMTNYAASVDLVGVSWGTRTDLSLSSFTVPPAIVALDTGPELLMTFVQQDTSIAFALRTGGVWSAAPTIANCYTNDRVALAALPGGRVILAFRGTDGNLYWLTWSGTAWSPVAPFSTPNVMISGPPAVADGANGHVAEIAFIESDGAVYTASLSGVVWSTPVTVGGTNLVGVAIATP